MWAFPPPPPSEALARRVKNGTLSAPKSPPLSPPPTSVLAQYHSQNLADLLEPAVDGPPSPESIRALSQQMRETTGAQDKNHSRQSQTTSSGSSSLRSLASSTDRPSWEHAFDAPPTSASGLSLSRKSSGRSTSSSMPSRERADSVQLFGRSIFSRRGKLRRESSAQSSASNSLYSGDTAVEPAILSPNSITASGGNMMPSLFSRRKTLRPESVLEESEAGRRLQISGPYNFQHLTHTQKESLPSLQRSNRTTLRSELSALRASQLPTHGALKGINAEDLSFVGFSTENLPLGEDGPGAATAAASTNSSRTSLGQALPSPPFASPPRGALTRSVSQEQMRMPPPPRPFRSPDDPEFGIPPVPPPRSSSRVSLADGVDVAADVPDNRGPTGAGLRDGPRLPATVEEEEEGEQFLHMRSHVRADSQVVPAEYRYSRVISSIPDDLNWPLTSPQLNGSFEAALPDVPEEEENPAPAKSRASVMSNSSLRGSQSVPLLRQMLASPPASASVATARPPSNASDTLGRFDLLAAQRALREALDEDNATEVLPRESWEDDIDYCYEHEAEADCEYAWERPSLDLARDQESSTPVTGAAGMGSNRSDVSASPTLMLSPGARFDMPALSPVSQMSTSTAVEAITPTITAQPVIAPGFSMGWAAEGKQQEQPHQGQQMRLEHLHVRSPSYASTFKESHGFNLSPSLLIPGSDYHRHMMDEEPEWYPGQDEITFVRPQYEEPVLSMDRSALLVQSRTSASTMASLDSDRMGSDRHISTASGSTALTRLTLSSSSVDIQGLACSDECPTAPLSTAAAAPVSSLEGQAEPLAPASAPLTRSRGQSEPLTSRPSSADNVFDEAFAGGSACKNTTATQRNFSHIMPTSPVKTKDDNATTHLVRQPREQAGLVRRQRAKTTSLATPPPHPSPYSYSLYPTVNAAGSRV